MGINGARVILGGAVAGLIVNVSEYLVNNVLLGDEWSNAMEALNRPSEMGSAATALFWLWGFMTGMMALWLYAAVRPRFGPGPKTAILAAIAVWVPGSLLGVVFPAALDLFPVRLMAIGVVAGLVELVIATLAGAWLYKEADTAAGRHAAAVRA
jgi:hypothetical protein